jgi:hypothetical protein
MLPHIRMALSAKDWNFSVSVQFSFCFKAPNVGGNLLQYPYIEHHIEQNIVQNITVKGKPHSKQIFRSPAGQGSTLRIFLNMKSDTGAKILRAWGCESYCKDVLDYL